MFQSLGPQTARRENRIPQEKNKMPLYLIHGFRWTRAQIRVFIILNNIEDATADYIQTPSTIDALLKAIKQHHPTLTKICPRLTFVEQHDPEDLRTGAQPFAFVADTVRVAPVAGAEDEGDGEGEGGEKAARRDGRSGGQIRGLSANGVYGQGLSMDVGAAMGRGGGIGGETWDAMADLRDEIAQDATVGWFAVWNGDVDRRDLGDEEEMGPLNVAVHAEPGSKNRSPTTRQGSMPGCSTSSHGREARNDNSGGGGGGGYVNGIVNGAGNRKQDHAVASGSQVRDDEDMTDADDFDDDDDDDDEEEGESEGETCGSAFTDND